MTVPTHWKSRARELRKLTYALYLAYRDPRTPWGARIVSLVVVGYAFSPIDLIPDFIPVLGIVDDLVLVPLGVALAVKLIPAEVWEEAKASAATSLNGDKPINWVAAGVIVALWIGIAVAGSYLAYGLLG